MSQFQMYDKRSKRSEDPMYYYADEFDEMLNENPDYFQMVDFGQKIKSNKKIHELTHGMRSQ